MFDPRHRRLEGILVYCGFLWKYVTMDPAGYEKFRDLAIRKFLEGHRIFAKDKEAISHVEKLLKREEEMA